jgi:hypothetical protein
MESFPCHLQPMMLIKTIIKLFKNYLKKSCSRRSLIEGFEVTTVEISDKGLHFIWSHLYDYYKLSSVPKIIILTQAGGPM